MKKIIALILALSCVLLLCACGNGNDDPVETATLADFTSAIAATNPTSVKLTTKLETELYDEPLTGSYDIVYSDDGSATVDYTYTLFNEIGTGSEGIVSEYSGTATIDKNGNVTGGEIGGQLTAAAAVSFNLDESKMTYSISAGTLTVNIKAADTAAVLGASTGADTVLTISIANGAVAGATITYVTAYGPATITCTYSK